jgi:anaerobic ribonucleoside-triphosphate reductase activating protein
MHWKLNRIQYPVYNLGKGKRIGIWVQGCSLGCKECISRTLQTFKGGKMIKIDALVNEIARVKNLFDGVTITGGEPFQQYKELIAFCAYLKQHTSLEIYVFSGYYLDEIYELYPDKLFLKYIDYLMDGRYINTRHDNENARGSNNQSLYKIINNEPVKQEKYFASSKFGLNVDKDSQVYLSGIPKQNELQQLGSFLNETGINITFK